MFILKLVFCAVSMTATTANGYKLAFYETASRHCTGRFLGSWSGGPEAGCRTDYVGVAQNVVVTSDSKEDHDNTVLFFSSNDCNKANVIVMSQGGCMAIDSAIASYSSFEVVEGTTRGKQDDENNASLPAHAWLMQQMKAGKSLWDFLNKPFVATIAGAGGASISVMYINNKWAPGKEKPAQCSSVGSEPDTLKGSIKEVTYLVDVEAVEIVLTLADGTLSTISVAITQKGNKCGVPATGA